MGGLLHSFCIVAVFCICDFVILVHRILRISVFAVCSGAWCVQKRGILSTCCIAV